MRKVPLSRPPVKRMSRASAPSALEVPLIATLDQIYHFGMFTMMAVLDGRATELIELAKVNLTR